jgi:hypothetical protein
LLDPDGEPQLAGPGAHEQEAVTPDSDQSDAPPVRLSGDLATLVADLRGSDAGSRELECLATGVYFEAKSEPLAGQLAVGQVIANRSNSGGRFPASYCGVLFQRGQFALGAAFEQAVADRRRYSEDRRSGPEEFGSRQCLVLSRALRVAGLAAEACGGDRQPRFLSLIEHRNSGGRGRASARPLSFRLRAARRIGCVCRLF